GETLGEEVEEPFARACHRASAGNPFLLRELLGTLAEEGVRPLAAFAGNVRRTTPAAVSLSVQRRLRGLSAEAGGLARSVGVLGDRVRLPDAAGLAALGDPAARAAASELARVDLLRPEQPCGFVHPTVRGE